MRFEFATATHIVFGPGSRGELAAAAKSFGRRALLVTGASGRHAPSTVDVLKQASIAVSEFHVDGEPTVEVVLAGLEQARRAGSEFVIGIGGGSVIDTGKAISALLANPGDILDYLEVVGKGGPLTEPAVPYIAMPTTAGTGAEVTRNAVLGVTERRVKVSLRSPSMLPRLAIVDPELTYGLPQNVTASSGLDAFTQLIEPFLSNAPNPMTDALCRDGIGRVACSLRRAYESDDPAARQDMSLAALFSGMALANAKLGAAHGFSGALGGMFHASHGAICARLLPLSLEANLHALQARALGAPVLGRFDELARIVTGDPQARAEEGIDWIKELCSALEIPPLASYGVQRSDFQAIVARSKKSSSMKGNPVELSDEELAGILGQAL